MKMRCIRLAVIVTVLTTALCGLGAELMGTAFTYQGQLKRAGVPVNDTADLTFSLWDDLTGGNQVGPTVMVNNVGVGGGLFTVELEFGVEVLNGDARWLEIVARTPAGTGNYTTLSPRQALTAAPYALQTRGVFVTESGQVGIGTTAPGAMLTAAGMIETTSDGFKFPDGTIQVTAATGGGGSLWTIAGSDIFYTAGSVGIGTTGPFHTLPPVARIVGSKLPRPSSSHACVTDPTTGKIYCLGGRSDAIVEYDPATDILVTKSARLSPGRLGLACAASAATGYIYCFGGQELSGLNALDEIVKYDPVNDTLEVQSTVLPSARYGLACAEDPATGKVYCFGGVDSTSYPTSYFDDILEYDPTNNRLVTRQAKLPSARHYLACATDSATRMIYCFGGFGEGGAFLDVILRYDPSDPDADPVEMNARLPSGRAGLACAADPSTQKIYCFGGMGGVGTVFKEILEYDPSSDELINWPITLPSARWALACAGGPATQRIYCFGGAGFLDPLEEIVEFDPFPYQPIQASLQVGDPGDGSGAMANSWSVFSSRAYKRDIDPLNQAEYLDILRKLKAMDVVRFHYSQDPRATPHLGVIAEDSPREILNTDGKAVSLADYTSFLMAAIKAQQALIEVRDDQVSDLQVRLERLEALVGDFSLPRPESGR